MKNIHFQGQQWQLYKQTPSKLVFVLAANPLATWRKKNKLTQRDAAVRLGISQGQLARIESGTRTISGDLLAKLHDAQ
jgi:DNA-binding XRE family transcriptional regulator